MCTVTRELEPLNYATIVELGKLDGRKCIVTAAVWLENRYVVRSNCPSSAYGYSKSSSALGSKDIDK